MQAKEEKTYLVVNLILLFVIIVILAIMYYLIMGNKNQIAQTYDENINVIQSTLQVEKINVERENTIQNVDEAIIPRIDETLSNTGKTLTNAKNNRYYYNQLESTAKEIYNAIESNLDNMKSGNYTIQLPDSVANILKESNGQDVLNRSFQSAWDALSLDRVDTFFIDVSKVNLMIERTTYASRTSYKLEIRPGDNSLYLYNGLNNKEMVDNLIAQVDSVKNNIIKGVSGDTYNKILQVHDWIIDSLEYNTNATDENSFNIYGALVERTAVCEGYAEAFKYILDELGIPCIIVSGVATNTDGVTENHAWNYVQLNGKWYAIDCTWDDPIVRGGGYLSKAEKHKYFLKGSNTMNKNHKLSGKVTKVGQEFAYPMLEANDY